MRRDRRPRGDRGPRRVFKDNVHPSTEGASLIAKTVYQTLTGKPWQGKMPGPLEVRKEKRFARVVENAGDVTYREMFAIIATDSGMPAEQLTALRDKFDETAPKVESHICELEQRIEAYDKVRMTYKHTTVEAEKPLYGEYKKKVAETKEELAKFRNAMNMSLMDQIPAEYKGRFGAGWLNRYISDRLAPIGGDRSPRPSANRSAKSAARLARRTA